MSPRHPATVVPLAARRTRTARVAALLGYLTDPAATPWAPRPATAARATRCAERSTAA